MNYHLIKKAALFKAAFTNKFELTPLHSAQLNG